MFSNSSETKNLKKAHLLPSFFMKAGKKTNYQNLGTFVPPIVKFDRFHDAGVNSAPPSRSQNKSSFKPSLHSTDTC